MAYNRFTLDTVILQFGLQVVQDDAPFRGYAPVVLSSLLREELAENVSLARDISTEKARSEFIIAPVLAEVRRQFHKQISVFSGVELNVDEAEGLVGVCDFLLSLSPLQLSVQAPIVVIVEAKNENIKGGLGQCIAEMLAAQRYSIARGTNVPTMYGVVTTGELWRFIQLQDKVASIAENTIAIEDAAQIVSTLAGMVQSARAQA